MSESKVSEVLFDIMQLEMINHIKNQHEIQPYLDAGLDPHQANDIVKRLISDKLIAMGHSVGRRIAMRLIDQEPKPQSLQGDANAPFRFLSKEIWSAVFNKSADNCTPIPTTNSNFQGLGGQGQGGVSGGQNHILKENAFRWTSRFSPTPSQDELDDVVLPYIWITCGLIKGSLGALGIEVEVTQEVEIKHKQVCAVFKITHVQNVVRSI